MLNACIEQGLQATEIITIAAVQFKRNFLKIAMYLNNIYRYLISILFRYYFYIILIFNKNRMLLLYKCNKLL